MSARLCAVCERERCEWARAENLQVVVRNRLRFPACQACWMRWPDEWRSYPREGFGRSDERTREPVAGEWTT